MTEIISNINNKMDAVVENLMNSYKDIRTSSANPSMLHKVEVEYYGALTPINQLATIKVVEGRQLYIQPFDPKLVKDIERAIFGANLGLTPQNEGNAVRINIPQLTEERRKELSKVASKYCEEAKVSLRNIRRDFIDKAKKNKDLSEDVVKDLENQIQKATDTYTKKLDGICADKIKDIMSI